MYGRLEGTIVKSAKTSIHAALWSQAVIPITNAVLYAIERALESVGRAFICLGPAKTVHPAPRLLDQYLGTGRLSTADYAAPFTHLPVAGYTRSAGGWYEAQTMPLRFAEKRRGTDAPIAIDPFDLTPAKNLNTSVVHGGTWWRTPREG